MLNQKTITYVPQNRKISIKSTKSLISRLFPERGEYSLNGCSPGVMNLHPGCYGFIIDEEDFAGSRPVIETKAFPLFFNEKKTRVKMIMKIGFLSMTNNLPNIK